MNAIGRKGSIVVCVSPLVSLMMDQKKFIEMGLSSDFVGESQSDRIVLQAIRDSTLPSVFVRVLSLLLLCRRGLKEVGVSLRRGCSKN